MYSTTNKRKTGLKKDLFQLLGALEDFRRAQGRMHELQLVLIIAIMSVMSGFHGLRSMSDFVKKNKKELLDLFQPPKDRLPSRQTIGRALQHIDFDKLTEVFYQWAINYVEIKNKEWLSIDGKAIGGTVNNSHDSRQNFINLVSVFASKRQQVIKAGKIENNKASEIPKVKELIKQLDLEGAIFTIDALHCAKETTKTIIDSKNDYVIGVKGNRKKLYNQLKKTRKKVNQ